jgi:hypothetical protein
MALMQVQQVAPRSEPVKQEKEKKSAMEMILEGLQIANGVLGIANNVQSIRSSQRTIEDKDYAAKGGLTKEQETDAMAKGMTFSDTPQEGGTQTFIRTPEGEKGVFIKPPGPKAEKADVVGITVPGPGGKPMTQFVEKKAGSQYEAYKEPDKPAKDITVAERNTLQSQYDRDPMVRKNRLVFSSYNEAKTYAAEGGPASDLSLIMAYYKANDPSSVVKETEAETAQALGGLENRAKAWYAKNSGDGGLTDAQRADLLRAIELKAQSAAKEQDGINNDFTVLSGRRGVNTQDLRLVSVPAFESKQNRGVGGGPGTALGAPSDAVPVVPLTDIEKEMQRRGIKPKGASGKF